ncbi:flagellar hook-basal body complex protein [Butyrivibrio sp. AE3003]|uniref:flagellar hook-basal body complex protein n=1 Tax=Butyrivibrio sp. AE3003 TaxID=1496721 RepID=UPI00068AB71E|nr:flagellar hook-basal body complex protein [Butyrivibrio sp. AE3003]
MMRSLYSGVAGLKTHQTKMDVIGNNIANVNTTSYKSQSITFSDLMYQTTQTASGATETKGGINPRQIGLGTKSGAINTAITSQGTTQTTNNPFDIMITGKSFFVVNNGVENLYTRDGSFYVDGAGNLAMQSNGYLVQGWAAKEDRETGEITVNKNGGLSSLQIMSPANFTYSPASTTAAIFNNNIDSNDTNVMSVDGKTITLEFYDNKGYLYTGKFTLKDTKDGNVDNHLFALTLTDIIDSNGNSLDDRGGLMSQITFGNLEGLNRVEKKTAIQGYTFERIENDSDHITINKIGGDVKYDNVKASDGKLSDLLSNGTKAGLLDTVYGITDEKAKTLFGEDYINAKYSVDSSGRITVTYPMTDYKDEACSGSYAWLNQDDSTQEGGVANKEKFFVDADTQVAYKVPTNGNANELSVSILKEVFEMNDSDISKYRTSDYRYDYDSNGTLSFYKKDIGLAVTSEPKEISSSVMDSFNFIGDAAGRKLSEIVSGVSNLRYTYSSEGVVSLFQMETGYIDADPETESLDSTLTDGDAIDSLFTALNKRWGSNNADSVSLDILRNVITDTTTYPDANVRKVAQAIVEAAQRKTNLTDENGNPVAVRNVKVKLGDETGNKVLVINFEKEGEIAKPYPNATTKYSKSVAEKTARFVEKDTTNNNRFVVDEPSYVFKNTSNPNEKFEKGYYLPGNKLTMNNLNADLIRDVFPSVQLRNGVSYNFSISTNGQISINHMETADPRRIAASEFSIEQNADGTIKYLSSSAFKEVPVTGKISDLLEAIDGKGSKEQGLLKKVYGISDKAAAAFGGDGTYEIITAEGSDFGKINLRIGDRTIQLQFDEATGSIVSADGDSKSKSANITFGLNGQDTEGLMAFGFQANPANAEEMKRNHTISIDFSNLTNYNTNKSSTITANKGDIKSLNTGRAVGEMNGINVSDNGQIYASYSNGQTKLLGQIASAEFANASGLSKQGDNLYASTLNSGDATIQDITTDGGYMSTGVLEMSNVDLSAQFTEMITTQRGFQANSRIITVSDTLLEELTNLKR